MTWRVVRDSLYDPAGIGGPRSGFPEQAGQRSARIVCGSIMRRTLGALSRAGRAARGVS